MTPKLSILIPSIPSRIDKLTTLISKLESLIGDKPVEILAFTDNKKRSIGCKRQALVDIAKGDYLAFLDDDDDLLPEYIDEVLKASESSPDVITFKQWCVVDGNDFIVDFDLRHTENEECKIVEGKYIDIKRKPFHVCFWKREIAQSERFPDVGYGEDWNWIEKIIDKATVQYKINKVLHKYVFDSSITEAPTETNDIWENPN